MPKARQEMLIELSTASANVPDFVNSTGFAKNKFKRWKCEYKTSYKNSQGVIRVLKQCDTFFDIRIPFPKYFSIVKYKNNNDVCSHFTKMHSF